MKLTLRSVQTKWNRDTLFPYISITTKAKTLYLVYQKRSINSSRRDQGSNKEILSKHTLWICRYTPLPTLYVTLCGWLIVLFAVLYSSAPQPGCCVLKSGCAPANAGSKRKKALNVLKLNLIKLNQNISET